MNQCVNAGAASLERCKRMAQSPVPPSTTTPPLLASLISFVSLSDSLYSLIHSLSLSYCRRISHIHYHLLCSHSTSLWHVYSFLSYFLYSIIPPSSCYVICSFHCLFTSSCSHYCIALLGAIVSTFCLLCLTVLSLCSPKLLIHSYCFQREKKESKSGKNKEGAVERWR